LNVDHYIGFSETFCKAVHLCICILSYHITFVLLYYYL